MTPRTIDIGGLRLTLSGAPSSPPHSPEPHRGPHPGLVWRSPTSGDLLAGGRAMTQPQAIFCCLTHTRNQVLDSQTTPTRITYRTCEGTVCVYEGTGPALTQPILNLPAAVRASVRRLAGLLAAHAAIGG